MTLFQPSSFNGEFSNVEFEGNGDSLIISFEISMHFELEFKLNNKLNKCRIEIGKLKS